MFPFATFQLPIITHWVLYAGLMDEEEVVPIGKSKGWASKCSPEYIAKFLSGRVVHAMQDKDFGKEIVDHCMSDKPRIVFESA